MAQYRSRRGSFGLQPRVAPNVTNQIVALAREYVAKRDQLIMDAWRNGGKFEGKKVTDQMVLDYWQDRYKDLDPQDPDYESAKNQVMQLQYGIQQSKMDLRHLQGKVSDTQYAQFFLHWAKKVPKNSEFYRTLQKDAAQLIESAKAKGRASAEAAKTEAFNKFVTNTQADHIAIGDALTAAIQDISQATGLSVTGNGDELLAMLTANVKANPDQYNVLLDAIKKDDQNFDGTFTTSYFTQHVKDSMQGYEMIADRALKGGYTSAYASASAGQATMSKWGQNLNVWPVADSYSTAESKYLKVMTDPNSSQMDKVAASAEFSQTCSSLAGSEGIDSGTKAKLEADAKRLIGEDAGDAPSFGPDMLGRPGVSPEAAAQIKGWVELKAERDADPAAFQYAPVDANGNYDPTGRGGLGIVPTGAVPTGAVGVMVSGADGNAVMAYVPTHNVYTTDPNNPSGSPKLAGVTVSYNVGGRNVQMWGYVDARGQNHWSLVSPLTEGAATSTDNKGDVYVSPPASASNDPLAFADQLSKTQGYEALGASLYSQLKAQKDSNSTLGASVTVRDPKTGSTTELEYKNGAFVGTSTTVSKDKDGKTIGTQTTPITLPFSTPGTNAFSQTRLSAGDVPGVTFDSALQASVSAAYYTQTQDQVNKYASDPAFQQQFLAQTMNTLGITDPNDPRIAQAWRSVTTGDPIAMSAAERKSRMAMERDDLFYPGAKQNDNNVTTPNITYGRPELVIPGMPGSKPPAPTTDFSDRFDRMNAATSDTVLPNLAPAPSPTPAPTVTPGPTPSPSPTTIMPTPTAPPPTAVPTAPVSAPTGAPTGGGGGARRR